MQGLSQSQHCNNHIVISGHASKGKTMLAANISSSYTANHEELLAQVAQYMLPTDVISLQQQKLILWMTANKLSAPIYMISSCGF
jgi:hypothetical protein